MDKYFLKKKYFYYNAYFLKNNFLKNIVKIKNWRWLMNKADLIEEVAKVTCSKKEAVTAVDATLAGKE